MKKILLFLILFLLFTSLSYSQFKNVKVNLTNNNPNEVSIAINPLNPLNLIAGSNLSNFYYSFDGGLTWGNDNLVSSENGVWGDPCLIFDLQGNGYYFHLSRPPGDFSSWIDRIVCQWSKDGGKTWSDPGSYTGFNKPKKQDKEWACADLTGITKNIYVTWTQFDKYSSSIPGDSSNIMFSYSSDFGKTWSKALRINQYAGDCLDSSNTVEGAVPCVGPNGEVLVAWSGPKGIVFDRSSDFGMTWLDNDISVTEQIGGWDNNIEGIYRCNGMPVTCCDISNGNFRGNIYINFSDSRNGLDDMDIFVIKSTDGGFTWGEVQRVNDDPVNNKKQQFMSWMSVDPLTGAINVIYYDRRDYSDLSTDVYLARSTDGGAAYRNYKISESSFIPKKFNFFGDYINVASYNDIVACIWQRMDKGILNIISTVTDFKTFK